MGSKSCVQSCAGIIIILCILAGAASVIISATKKKNKNEKYYSNQNSGKSEYPNYFVYQKKHLPFSDQTKGEATPYLPKLEKEYRIDKEPYSSCNEFCN